MKPTWFGLIIVFGVALSPMELCAEPKVNLASPSEHQALAADLATNAQGDIALLWVDRSPTMAAAHAADASAHQHGSSAGSAHAAPLDRHIAMTDLYVAISQDGGKTFTAPVKVNSSVGAVWGQAVSRPRIVASADGNWHVSYAANEQHPQLGKTALTTHYTRSSDGGKTFESPRRLSALTDQDMSEVIHGGFVSAAAFGSIAVADDSAITVVWIDTRHMDETSNSGSLYVNVSRDGGKTFEGERKIIETGVCPCCQIMAVNGEQGDILIGSRAVDGDNYRAATVMRLAKSGGVPVRRDVGDAPWQIEGCPLKPTVIAQHSNHVFTAVHSGGETQPGVIFSVSRDRGQQFVSRGLVHAAATVSDSPAIATNGRSVALAWHAKTTGPWAIHYQFYDLDGVPLGAVEAIDSGKSGARAPVITSKVDGSYFLAWQQDGRIQTTTLQAPTP